MKNLQALKLFVLFILTSFIMASCHTKTGQKVGDQIKGVWSVSPIDSGRTEKWVFKADGNLEIYINGVMQKFQGYSTFADSYSLRYTVNKKGKEWQVKTDGYWGKPDQVGNLYWIITKIDNSEMYFSSYDNNHYRSNYQKGFVRR